MKKDFKNWGNQIIKGTLLLAALFLGVFGRADLHAFTLNVADDNGNPITNGFRYLVEEDNTFLVTPGVSNPTPGIPESHTLGVNIHRSHAPVVCSGDTSPDKGATALPGLASAIIDATHGCAIDPAKRYMVSVLPWHSSAPGAPPFAQKGWTQSGRNVAAGQTNVTVIVHAFPVPTAQITLLVFHDNSPINGAFDMPAEVGLPAFTIILTDPAGGQVMQDAFAMPLGTTYLLNPDGTFQIDPATGLPMPDYIGDGNLKTCPTGNAAYDAANCVNPDGTPLGAGEAVIRFLNGNKYTIEIVPPNQDPTWLLTSTLEGTRGNDVWIRPGEPRFNIVLGQLNWLVFYGFVKPCNVFGGVACTPLVTTLPPGPTSTITGQVVYVHDMRPPLSPGLSPGLPVPSCYVGLNNLSGADEQVYTAPCNPDSTFSIANVPPGNYQLVIWDKDINAIIDFRNLVVPATGGAINLGKVAVYGWFGTYMGSVFNDTNRNARRDCATPACDNAAAGDEVGIPNQLINIRFTDGSVYTFSSTDNAGNFSINTVFPWWRWVVAEVDGGRFKATGLTAVVDDGGPLPTTGPLAAYGAMGINPQIQPDGLPYRTEQGGAVYTEPMILYSDMTNRIDWGKSAYLPGEYGSIAGVVYYATTRTEEDPQNGVADPWEPGIPRVTVNLYKAVQDGNGSWVPAGDVFMTYVGGTDSFDDNNPSGCVGPAQVYNGVPIKDCAETFRTWNQIRPGIYDGAYFFEDVPPGNYIVEIVPSKGYEVLKWGDRNIEFGDPKIPLLLYPPPCVGSPYPIPQYHTLFPDQQVPTEGWFPGRTAPLCDKKWVQISEGQNGAADFFLFTPVPKAGRIWGWVSDDLHLEFNPNSPNAGANLAPSWMPVSLKDYKGVEVARVYTDQWGKFNALVPANYDIAPPIPLGLALSMISIFPNDPGPILDTRPGSPTFGKYITDPWFNRAYGQEVIRENWEFYPGRTTFVDTIVIPISAFVTNRVPLSCEFLDNTPEIYSVSGPSGGPVVSAAGGDVITILSAGTIQVTNPNYNPSLPVSPTNPSVIPSDHGFGSIAGTVTVGGVALTNLVWAADGGSIQATVPAGVSTGQLIVTRGDNQKSTPVAVTLHVGVDPAKVKFVSPPPANCSGVSCARIQPVIDAANNGDLILVAPGTYQENLIFYKPVKLQGWGAASTVIDGTLALGNLPLKDAWNTKFQGLLAAQWIDTVPGNPGNFTFETGAGIFVASCNPDTATGGSGCPNGNQFTSNPAALIDGITLTGANESGGGIYVNGYATYLAISNMEIYANQGTLGGGIRLGTPSLTNAANTGSESSHNEFTNIHHNRIAQNGSLLDGAGGISIFTGADHYQVTDNMICGNFSANYGGGIDHFGLSDGGLIARNKIVSNESFDEAGGIMIAGELVPAAAPAGTLTQGSGSVTVVSNLIQGNKSGDDGGGLRTLMTNGEDVRLNPADQTKWWAINVFNNMIVNNSSADVGGGISMDDTVKISIINNTIADNDSTSTSSDSFGGPCVPGNPPGQVCPIEGEGIGGLVNSLPNVGGMAAYAFSTGLQSALTTAGVTSTFSNPVLINNIIWHNRSFFWDASINGGSGGLLPITAGNPPAPSPYWDLAVYNTATPQVMNPQNCILTDGTGATPDASNRIGQNPVFVNPYFNINEATSKGAAFGNFVTTTFTPTGLRGDYHILSPSAAVDAGRALSDPSLSPFAELTLDYDGEVRPNPSTSAVDIGADEFYTSATPVPGVFRLGVFRSGQWFLELNGNGVWEGCGTDACIPSFGMPGDIPISGDWDGSGRSKIGVFRNGQWYLDLNGGGVWDGCGTDACYASFGMAGDIPIAGDWTGTGTAKIGVFRSGQWFLDLNGNGVWDGCGIDACYASFGMAGDIPVVGDWSGTGAAKIGVFRSGQWFLDLNGNGVWDGCGTDTCYASFGKAGDLPLASDWNGTGVARIGVFRNGTWYLDLNGNGAWDGCGSLDGCYSFGQSGDKPVAGAW